MKTWNSMFEMCCDMKSNLQCFYLGVLLEQHKTRSHFMSHVGEGERATMTHCNIGCFLTMLLCLCVVVFFIILFQAIGFLLHLAMPCRFWPHPLLPGMTKRSGNFQQRILRHSELSRAKFAFSDINLI